MAASTCTSKTGTVTGTTPNFIVTKKLHGSKEIIVLLKYTKSTDNLTVTMELVGSTSTAKYRTTNVADDGTIAVQSISLTATSSLRVPVKLASSDTNIYVNLTFAGDAGSDCVVDFIEE